MKLNKTVYNYRDSKKIYLSTKTSEWYLFEKKDCSSMYICQLLKRNPIITYCKSGMIIYPIKEK